LLVVYFFFSSRRRHTRSKRDWSSDVCSSDLDGGGGDADVVGRTVGPSDSRTVISPDHAFPSDGPTVRPSDVFLGADAGGSHSTVVIGTADLTILGRADGPPASMKPGGAAASAAVLGETARRAATQARIDLPTERAVVAAAGA